MVDSKLYFHCQVDFVYSQALRTLGLIRFITYNFSSLDSLVVLYIVLIRSKLEHASVIWNKLTLADSNKIYNIQIKFANLCYYRYFQFGMLRNHDLILSHLNFSMLYSRRQHLDALFRINIFKGKINCHSIIDTVGIRVPTRQIREFSTFSVSSALRHSPSARRVIAKKEICRLFGHFWQKHHLFWGHLLDIRRYLDDYLHLF
jgi:hypothetical protein